MKSEKYIVPILCIISLALSAALSAMIVFGRVAGYTLHSGGELALAAGVCLLVYISARLYIKDKDSETAERAMRTVIGIWLAVYALLLLDFTLFSPYFGRTAQSTSAYSEYLSLVPLKSTLCFFRRLKNGTISCGFFAINMLGNLAAFAPLSLLPLRMPRVNSLPKFAAVCVLCVSVVEASQLAMRVGVCDIDDLLINTLGACIAYMLLRTRCASRAIKALTLLDYE